MNTLLKRCYFLLFACLLFSTCSSAQKMRRIYRLQPVKFTHAVSYTSGNAILFIEKDSLLHYYDELVAKSAFAAPFKAKIKALADSVRSLAVEPVNISAIISDQGLKNITEEYFIFCITKKQVLIKDKRNDMAVRKVKTKKLYQNMTHYLGRNFYLPHDRQQFMCRLESVRCHVKFL
ncbi:MAG: hypothetical protein JWO44_1815 [Bacteroidetes bacterium]|nr:hypothetical protein [Bacteroidota bacterium]